MIRARILASFALIALLVSALPACSREPAPRTADQVLTSIRAAVAAGDGEALFALYDRESRGFYRSRVREWKARLARGDDATQVLGSKGADPEFVKTRSEEQVAADFAAHYSPLLESADWLAGASEKGERESHGVDGAEMRLLLEGEDGDVRELWLVLQGDGWAYDHYRTDIR